MFCAQFFLCLFILTPISPAPTGFVLFLAACMMLYFRPCVSCSIILLTLTVCSTSSFWDTVFDVNLFSPRVVQNAPVTLQQFMQNATVPMDASAGTEALLEELRKTAVLTDPLAAFLHLLRVPEKFTIPYIGLKCYV
ncbi:hypothetical protein CANCADRAFT_112346 [Tortispora caseinolytica NRRL Y-17796]|uniref:Uncharacterized protein n=1 Tax=Tortispora caseinolytica NRRL Y-17796 TaxID=767744 RepID=A0A1E4TGG8_9ASCO|nr:hypothetical protein CANCADRAFT_112346 [Tortispora caseinolytica NRRL Y-17796]